MGGSGPIKFLKNYKGEWWSPNEIAKTIKIDIRTVKNSIARARYQPWKTTYEGWRLEIAERGKRIYAVRLMLDLEDSKTKINAEISEVESLPTDNLDDIKRDRELILKHAMTLSYRDMFLRYLSKALSNPNTDAGHNNYRKLVQTIHEIKNYKLTSLHEYLEKLS